MNWRQFGLVLSGVFLLASCATNEDEMSAAPVLSMQEMPKVMPKQHTVRSGESLYSIAWAYDKDYKDIAHDNNIDFPYMLKVGQVLHLSRAPAPAKKASVSKAKSKAKSQAPKQQTVAKGNSHSQWHWPVSGRLIQAYSDSVGNPHKGIDISNDFGSPIKAAANGKVVYSGEGLRGYGKLIIIKHDKDYLSAYAHNSKLFVQEGDKIVQGQKIAAMGNSESENVKLHFEIRKNGQPIDPLDIMPPMHKGSIH